MREVLTIRLCSRCRPPEPEPYGLDHSTLDHSTDVPVPLVVISLSNAYWHLGVFGLGTAVFTADIERGRRIAATELEAGCCFVNAFVKSDPRLPFGGVKESGYGRELAHCGIKEFVNIKTVYVA